APPDVSRVPPVDRQFLALAGIDVAAERRVFQVDEWRFAGDRDGFLNRRWRHLQIQRSGLSDEHLDVAPHGGRETLQLARDPVIADSHWNAINAALVGHPDKRVTR